MFGTFLVIQGLIICATGFPDGAPSDTCVKARAVILFIWIENIL